MNKLSFRIWLEDDQKDYEFYKDLVIGKLNSNDKSEKYDISTSLNMWKPPENLISSLEVLGEFRDLNDDVQMQVKDKISSGDGTLEDNIRLMAKEAKK